MPMLLLRFFRHGLVRRWPVYWILLPAVSMLDRPRKHERLAEIDPRHPGTRINLAALISNMVPRPAQSDVAGLLVAYIFLRPRSATWRYFQPATWLFIGI